MLLTKKNPDGTTVPGQERKKKADEIKQYLNGRYVCAVEAAWRLFGFKIHYRYPSVDSSLFTVQVRRVLLSKVLITWKKSLKGPIRKASSLKHGL